MCPRCASGGNVAFSFLAGDARRSAVDWWSLARSSVGRGSAIIGFSSTMPSSWSREEKDRIVGETFAPGANVSAIARSHGLDPSQLFAWRRKALASGMVAPLSGARGRVVKFARFEAVASDYRHEGSGCSASAVAGIVWLLLRPIDNRTLTFTVFEGGLFLALFAGTAWSLLITDQDRDAVSGGA